MSELVNCFTSNSRYILKHKSAWFYIIFINFFLYVIMWIVLESVIPEYWLNTMDYHMLFSVFGIPLCMSIIYTDQSRLFINDIILLKLRKKYVFDFTNMFIYFCISNLGLVFGNLVLMVLDLFFIEKNFYWVERRYYSLSWAFISMFSISLFMLLQKIMKKFSASYIAYIVIIFFMLLSKESAFISILYPTTGIMPFLNSYLVGKGLWAGLLLIILSVYLIIDTNIWSMKKSN